MATFYWYKTCPVCSGQGRLIITEDITNHRLYLHCEECEWGWLNPDKASDPAAGFLTLDEEFDTRMPDWNTIEYYDWTRYARHVMND